MQAQPARKRRRAAQLDGDRVELEGRGGRDDFAHDCARVAGIWCHVALRRGAAARIDTRLILLGAIGDLGICRPGSTGSAAIGVGAADQPGAGLIRQQGAGCRPTARIDTRRSSLISPSFSQEKKITGLESTVCWIGATRAACCKRCYNSA